MCYTALHFLLRAVAVHYRCGKQGGLQMNSGEYGTIGTSTG